MVSTFTEIRGQAMGIDVRDSAPTAAESATGALPAGRIYQDSTTGNLYIYNGTAWKSAAIKTSTSTSSTSSSSSSISTTSSSSSSSSSSTSTTSTSTTSSSTSTTLF